MCYLVKNAKTDFVGTIARALGMKIFFFTVNITITLIFLNTAGYDLLLGLLPPVLSSQLSYITNLSSFI